MKNQNRVFLIVLVSVVSIMLSALAWLTNFGWLRAYLFVKGIPFIHATVFLAINVFSAFFYEKCHKIGKVNLIFTITYLLVNILLPDYGDGASGYFFFGFVKDGSFLTAAMIISIVLLAVHIALLAVQIIMMVNVRIKEKRRLRKE